MILLMPASALIAHMRLERERRTARPEPTPPARHPVTPPRA